MSGSWQSNKDDVNNHIKAGGWLVAFGREITETDAAEGAVAAGVSVITGEPGPILAWVNELIDESVAQMEASVVATFTDAVRQQAAQFARGVITNLLKGKNIGEQVTNLFHFNCKVGVAQYIGQNFTWVLNLSPQGGYWQYIPPNIISECPYIALRFDASVGTPATAALPRLQWVADNGVWYNRHEPGLWHEFLGLQTPHFVRALHETSRDNNYVYLRDQTAGSHMELALGADRQFYHYTDGQPGWHPDIKGHWKA